MKPKSIIILLLGIAASLCLATQCPKEENPNELPDETQTGFGCYVDGQLFVNSSVNIPYRRLNIHAWYYRQSKDLVIHCQSNTGTMDLYFNSPRGGECNSLEAAVFKPYSEGECYIFACENCSQVFISRFDTIGNNVSGTFEFSGKCADYAHFDTLTNFRYIGESKIQVTNGRFNIPLQID